MARTKGKYTAAELVELYKTHSATQLAEMDGTTYGCVIKILHRAGCEMRKRGNNSIRKPPQIHGHASAALAIGMTVHRYVRLRAVQALGGVCNECGEDDLRVLDINHINGEKPDGRRRAQALYHLCLAILDGKQCSYVEVLCCNCNRRHEYDRGTISPIPEEFYADNSAN